MRKKLVCMVMCCCFLFSLVPTVSFAEEVVSGTCGENLIWEYQDGTLTVSGAGAMTDYTVDAPAPWLALENEIQNAVIGSGVTSVGAYAFYDCEWLRTISLPDGIDTVGNYAFYQCIKLTEISLPDSIQHIGSYAFYNCSKLQTAQLGRTADLSQSTALEIEDNAFRQCFSLSTVVYNRRIEHISDWTFYYCSNLENMTIPHTVSSIGAYVFARCTNLHDIILPDGVAEIGECTFYECISMEYIVLPASVSTVAEDAFGMCTQLKNIYYSGTGEQWQSMEIASGNTIFTDCNVHPHLPENWSTEWSMDSLHHWHSCAVEGCTADKLSNMAGYGRHSYHQKIETNEYLVKTGTCTEGAVYQYSCICGAAGIETFVAGDGSASHTWDDGSILKQPTLTESGEKVYVCTVCGETKTEELPMLKNSFSDVDSSRYYALPIAWAISCGITNGTSPTTFEPETMCTRGQIVTFLWRAQGSPKPNGNTVAFADIPQDSYCYEAAVWAAENHITYGTGEQSFSPNEGCTRAQTVTFLWRMSEQTGSSEINRFTDVKPDAYYYDAVMWAVQNGITNGMTATAFQPEQLCTRGQVVTFLYRASLLTE